MKQSVFIAAMMNLVVIAAIYIGLTLFLPGCTSPGFNRCANNVPSCQLDVFDPGIYMVTYLNTAGDQQTLTTTITGDSVSEIPVICDCSKIVTNPVLIKSLDPQSDLSVAISESPDPAIV